jgi:hypothetical protein
MPYGATEPPDPHVAFEGCNERHEIVVETDESTFVFAADSCDGRVVIQQRRKQGSRAKEEVCSLWLANPDELEAFFDARARGKNAKAFEPWTSSEEEDARRRYEAGESIDAIARAHNRSPKAIRMRLERLGAVPPSDPD